MRRCLPIALAGLVLLAGCAGSTQAYPSPDGRFGVEVTKDTHLADPVWRVVVQVGVAGTVGSWEVGCLSPAAAPIGVSWTGPRTFRVTAASGAFAEVALEASGEPAEVTPSDGVLVDC